MVGKLGLFGLFCFFKGLFGFFCDHLGLFGFLKVFLVYSTVCLVLLRFSWFFQIGAMKTIGLT